MKTGIEIIANERARQLMPKSSGGEGWTHEHDASHTRGELVAAASCYAVGENLPIYRGTLGGHPQFDNEPRIQMLWPWGKKWWKPSRNRIKDLARAGALIAAEIDRVQEANQNHPRA